MGIHDRHYTAAPQPRRRLSVTVWLIIINCIVFVLTAMPIPGTGWPMIRGFRATEGATGRLTVDTTRYYLSNGAEATSKDTHTLGRDLLRPLRDKASNAVGQVDYEVVPALYSLGHFSTLTAFQQLQVWRLVTFQFLHAGIMHLFFNMLGLWMMGRFVEENLGGKKYLAFYLVCGICGGLLYLILNGLGNILGPSVRVPGLLFNETHTPLVGASAGVFGVIMACAYLAPNAVVQLIFPPIPLKMRTFAYAYVAIALASLFIGTSNAGGEAAHVGGAIAGFFFIRNTHLLRDFFDVFSDSRRAKRAAGRAGPAPIFRTSEAEKDAQFQQNVDAILDKVRAQGLQSLTDKEKKTLEDAPRRER
jgi:membrane associated rhomboid family serine protease